MTKGIPHEPETIDMVRKLYLEGLGLTVCAKAVQEATGRPCTIKTISDWAHKYGWVSPKKPKGKALQKVETKMKEEIANTQDQLKAYRKMRDLGIQALDSVNVKNVHDAVELIDLGIKGERRIEISVWMRSFLDQVAKILMEEIADPDVLHKIALRFKTDLKDYVLKEKQ